MDFGLRCLRIVLGVCEVPGDLKLACQCVMVGCPDGPFSPEVGFFVMRKTGLEIPKGPFYISKKVVEGSGAEILAIRQRFNELDDLERTVSSYR